MRRSSRYVVGGVLMRPSSRLRSATVGGESHPYQLLSSSSLVMSRCNCSEVVVGRATSAPVGAVPPSHSSPTESADTATSPSSVSTRAATRAAPFFKLLRELDMSAVVKMSDNAVLLLARRYLKLYANIDRLRQSKKSFERVQGRQAARALRFGKLSVRQMVFLRVTNNVVGNKYSFDASCRLLNVHWPLPLAQYHSRVRRHVANRILSRLQPVSVDPATDVNASEPRLTPPEARRTLRAVCSSFKQHTQIIGPLATVCFEDIKSCQDASQIIMCMWAVHMARTHAPDRFWRSAVERLVELHRTKTAVHADADASNDKDDAEAEGLFSADDAEMIGEAGQSHRAPHHQLAPRIGALTPMQIFRILRVAKREHWSGDVGALSYLASEALGAVLKRFRKFVAERPQAFANKGDVHHLSKYRAERTHVYATGLTPVCFMSLLIIAGELGHRFPAGFTEVTDAVLCPVIRTLRGVDELLVLCEMLRGNRVHHPPLFQAAIDTLTEMNRVEEAASNPSVANAGVLRPETIWIAELLVREIVRAPPHLIQQLQLQHFMHFLLLIAREKRKFSPSSMLSLTSNMYQVHRMLLKTSHVVHDLRSAVDEFAFQLDRMLQHAVVSVNLVNSFLEYRILLGMGGTDDAAKYPNVHALLESRNRLYRHYHHHGMESEFNGIVVRTTSLVAGSAAAATSFYSDRFACNKVADMYQSIFTISQRISWQRKSVPPSMISDLRQLAFRTGVFAAVESSRLIGHLHKENREGRISVTIPAPVMSSLKSAVIERIDTCGLRPHIFEREKLPDDELQRRILTALGAPRQTTPSVDRNVATAVVDAFVFSPLAPQLVSDDLIVGFLRAVVSLVKAEDGGSSLATRVESLIKSHRAPPSSSAATPSARTAPQSQSQMLTPLFSNRQHRHHSPSASDDVANGSGPTS